MKNNTNPYVINPGLNNYPQDSCNIKFPNAQPYVGDIIDLDKLKKESKEAHFEKMMTQASQNLEPDVKAELFNPIERVFKALGFQARKEARWYHPILGEDFEHNWLYFDLHTDSLQSIVPKLFRSGYVKGQKQTRMDVRAVLDI
jgi:hypothetical protein